MKKIAFLFFCFFIAIITYAQQEQNYEFYENKAKQAIADSKFENAIEYYNKAIELNPTNPKLYLYRGKSYGTLKKYNEALTDITKAIELDPKYTKAYYSKGVACGGLQEFYRAIDAFTKAIELNPDYSEAYDGRGYAKKNLMLYVDKYRKRNQRGRDIKLVGIKSIECNFNPKEKTYNPHLHLLLPSKQIADILVKEWLLYWKELTYKKAQFSRPVKDTENDLIEVIKYSTKVFTEFDPKKKEKKSTLVYVAAIDNIMAALKPHRIFDRFGFNLPPAKKPRNNFTKLNIYQEWHFDVKKTDWLNVETYKPLSGYKPPPELAALLIIISILICNR